MQLHGGVQMLIYGMVGWLSVVTVAAVCIFIGVYVRMSRMASSLDDAETGSSISSKSSRSKVSSLPTQLRQGLASCGKDASPAFLDTVTATSQRDHVRMTVGASDLGDVSDDNDNDDAVARGRQRQPQDVHSAAVDIGAAPVHS